MIRKLFTYENIGSDFSLDVLSQRVGVNIDGTTIYRKPNGQLASSGNYEPTIGVGTLGDYWRGDKTWQPLAAVAITGNYTDLSNTPNLNLYVLKSTVGAANGVAPVDASGFIPSSYINFSGATFKGTWDADTNTPTLADGTGANGDFYIVSVAGTRDLGVGGSILWGQSGIAIYNSNLGKWQFSGSSMTVSTVNGYTGTVSLTTTEIPQGTNLYFTQALARAAISVSGNYLTYSGGVITSSVPTLAAVATSNSYTDLSNKPTIPAAQVNSDWTATSGITQVLNKPTLSAVAVSGSYLDLSNRPDAPNLPVIVSVTSSTTISPTSQFYTVVVKTSGTSQTLPTSSIFVGYVINIKNGSSGNIETSGSMDGTVQSLTIPPLASVQLQYDGTTWWIL